MLKLYDNRESRNGYKVVLLLNQLGTAFERVEVDIFKGESRTPEFLAKNPAGNIPALELEDGTVLAESGAILWYLAEGTAYLPGDRIGRAQVLRWIFFEQNAHETSIAESRFILSHPELSRGREGDILAEKQKRGNAALALIPTALTAILSSSTVAGSTCVTSKSALPRMATGITPWPSLLKQLGSLPGLMSMATVNFRTFAATFPPAPMSITILDT